jgi:predicted nucleic acid-binding Zn ribbon protein
MPIYEYRCECGATLESLESVGSTRSRCGELCPGAARPTGATLPAVGAGQLERLLSAPGIRGDGHEAKEQVFDPVKRANRPGCDDCSCDN